MDTLLELGKMVLPAALVLYAMFMVVRSFTTEELEMRRLEVRTRSIETILPARLQALRTDHLVPGTHFSSKPVAPVE